MHSNSNYGKKWSRLYLDTETTGFKPGEDEILQVAICDQEGRAVWNRLYRPERAESWEKASAVNGIWPEDVVDKPSVALDVDELQEIFNAADELFIYNAAFDLPFLTAAGLDFSKHSVRDTMLEYAELKKVPDSRRGGFKWHKLVSAAADAGYAFEAHDALEDARATAVVQAFLEEHRRAA